MSKKKTLKVREATRTQENMLAEPLENMVRLISQYFRSQVIEAMTKETVSKFQDAKQVGNYSKRYLTLVKALESKVKKRFNNKRIDKLVSEVLGKVNKRNQSLFYTQLGRRLGIDPEVLVLKESMKATTNALILETSQWAKGLRDQTLEMYTNNTLAAMTRGEGLDDILMQFDGMVEKRRNHAQFTAFNQAQNFNAILGKIRAQNAGISTAVWRTSNDERVRPSHKQRNGKEFVLSEGLYSSLDQKKLIPGVDYRCRCFAEYVLDDEDNTVQ